MMELSLKQLFVLMALCVGCGGNVAEDQAEKTSEQQAQEKMNDQDYEGAIEILEPLAEEEPEEYFRFPLLAAAYMGNAGVDLVSMLKNQLSSAASGSIFEQVDSFLPDEYTSTEIAEVAKATSLLAQIPSALRGEEGDETYGASAEFQYVLYNTVYGAMIVNQFLSVDANGNISYEDLENMTDAEVATILAALQSAAASSDDSETSTAVSEALTDIDESDGSTDKEQLISYISASE